MEKSLVERDKQVIWHPYTPQKYNTDPIPVVRGEGVYLVDSSGKYYIDAISSWWVNLHGHAHPYIAEKIYEQAKTLEQVIFAGFTHRPAVELAERLLNVLPGDLSKIFYSDNGSTAVEVAIKMATQYWWNKEEGVGSRESGVGSQESGGGSREFGERRENLGMPSMRRRSKIIALKNSYHGDTFGAMSVSERGIFTLAFQDKLFDVIFIDPTNLDRVVTGLEKGFVQLASTNDEGTQNNGFTVHFEEIACFIYEPLLQGAGGMKVYEAEPLNGFLHALQQKGVLCIADEVMTGFGRTGKLFASEYVPSKPDIICLSKGLTGGTMALGVTACSKKVHDAFVSDDKLKTFFHGHSYTANPLACTAALASLDLLLGEDCRDNITRIHSQHCSFLNKLQTSHLKLQTKNHRCIGTVLAFEIETGEDNYFNNVRIAITQKSLSRGVFLRPLGNTLYIMPPYCISGKELNKIYDVIIEILNDA